MSDWPAIRLPPNERPHRQSRCTVRTQSGSQNRSIHRLKGARLTHTQVQIAQTGRPAQQIRQFLRRFLVEQIQLPPPAADQSPATKTTRRPQQHTAKSKLLRFGLTSASLLSSRQLSTATKFFHRRQSPPLGPCGMYTAAKRICCSLD